MLLTLFRRSCAKHASMEPWKLTARPARSPSPLSRFSQAQFFSHTCRRLPQRRHGSIPFKLFSATAVVVTARLLVWHEWDSVVGRQTANCDAGTANSYNADRTPSCPSALGDDSRTFISLLSKAAAFHPRSADHPTKERLQPNPTGPSSPAIALHSNAKPITITNQSTRTIFVARFYEQCYTIRALDALEHVLTQAKISLPLSPNSLTLMDPRPILDPIRQLIQQPLSHAITPAPAHKLMVTEIPPGQQRTLPAIQPDLLPHLCLSESLVFSDRQPTAVTDAVTGRISIEFVHELVIQRDERGRLEALTPVDLALRGWVTEIVSAVGKRVLSPETLDQVKQGMQDRQRFPELEQRVQAWESQRPSMQEASHVHARRHGVVKKAFRELVGREVEEDDVPVVAVAMSGGGYRAMLAAAGFLQGLADTGVLPLTTYISALSGSTYTLTQWLLTPSAAPSRLIDLMTPRLQLDLQDLLINADTSTLVTTLTPLIQKQFLRQPIALADFFGCLVAAQLVHPLLSPKHYPTMSDVAAHVDPQAHPWPMFTGVSHDVVNDRYAWIEFDPVNANVMWFDRSRPGMVARVPMVGVGREFVDRVSVDSFPEIPLSLLLGLWGSAFSGTVAQGWAELKSTLFPTLPATLPSDTLIHHLDTYLSANPALATDHPIPPTFIPNPWYDPRRAVAASNNLLASQPALSLMDAGLVCNLPLPTLVHPSRARKVDVILVLDASSDIGQPGGVPHMRVFKEFAKEWGVGGMEGNASAWQRVLSVGNAGGQCDQPVYVIPGSPTLVYVPLLPESGVEDVDVNGESWCGTGNFLYSEEQARSIVEMVRSKVVRGREEILNAILGKYGQGPSAKS